MSLAIDDEWIDLGQYKNYFPTEGTVRINHCKPEESNRKFYLTRSPEGDKILAFCHHCGKKGVYNLSPSSWSPPPNPLEANGLDPFKKFRVPSLDKYYCDARWLKIPFEDLTLEMRRWWFKSGLLVSEYNTLDIKLLDGNRLAIPLTENFKQVTGLAFRQFRDNAPKWLILGKKTVHPFTYSDNPTDTLVIVEDYLSAVRLARFTNTLPLMGTNLSSLNFSQILFWVNRNRDLRKVLIWLDNDSPQVIKLAEKIYKKLVPICKCQIITEKKEPKHFKNQKDLVGLIYGT